MSLREQRSFSTGLILNLIVAGGISWIHYSDTYRIPESLGWLARIYFMHTSYAAMGALLQTSIAAKAMAVVKWCLGTALLIAVLPFAIIWQVGKLSLDAARKAKNQKKMFTALESQSLGDYISPNPTIESSSSAGSHPLAVKSSYHYREFQEADEIRLLEVFPTAREDEIGPLRGRIVHSRLSESPPFTALSYCWNDVEYPSPTESSRSPVLDLGSEGSLVLTRNLINGLHSALKTGHFKKNLVWVDQISINQDDLIEKSSQVALMKDIYKQADLVLVWLGNDSRTRDGDRALQFADLIATCINEKRLLSPEFDFFPITYTSNNLGLPPIHAAPIEYMSLINLLNRPWFERSWVVQEISLNAKKQVLCGSSEVSFDSLATALFFCTKSLDFLMDWVSTEVRGAFRAMIQSSVFTRRDFSPPSSGLLDVLVRHRGCKATLATDKIFAFLNISEDCESLGIEADYTISTRALFIKTAVAMIKYYDHLDLLSSANAWPNGNTNGLVTAEAPYTSEISQAPLDDKEHPLEESHSDRLPSWVPDWSVPTIAPSLQSKGEFGEYFSNYQATGSSVKSFQLRMDNTQLGLNGHILDRIVNVGVGFADNSGLDIGYHYRTIKSWGDMCGAWDKKNMYDFTQEDMLTAFSNTLTCGSKDVVKKSSILVAPPFTEPRVQSEDAEKKDWLGGDDSFEAQFNQLLVVLRVNWILNGIWPGIAGYPLAYNAMMPIVMIFIGTWLNIRKLTGLGVPLASVSPGFRHRVFASITHRRFIRTENGFIGLASPQAQPGDYVALFAGGNVPIVVRDAQGPEDNSVLWEIVGDAYVHGAMFGEGFLPENQRGTLWIC